MKEIKVTMIKKPTSEDWIFCKQCTLNTVGKTSTKEPIVDWKHRLLECEHSPIRTLWFAFKLEIPYYVSVHLSRHKFGVEHFVTTQRTDRTGVDRARKTQGSFVTHILYINAAELMFMARKRLCQQADPTTREVMIKIRDLVYEECPEFEGLLVPECKYRGGECHEMFPCYEKNS